MGRGLGETQQAILTALADPKYFGLTISDLATRLDRSPRQIRTAVRALERRDLVVVTKEYLDWQGAGEYGRLVVKRDETWGYRRDRRKLPTVLVVEENDDWPLRSGWVATERTEFTRVGMPVRGLIVWLPERHQAYENQQRANLARIFGDLRS